MNKVKEEALNLAFNTEFSILFKQLYTQYHVAPKNKELQREADVAFESNIAILVNAYNKALDIICD